ncbi:MAG: hypothetical protein JWP29_4748 [Rhodoferax sp.]|nr:hypothetical protein [Rhodoferax sp.]
MKLTADTPPNGDFVRYLEALERASPAYQSVLAPHTPGAVQPSAAAAALAERLRAGVAQRLGHAQAALPPPTPSPAPQHKPHVAAPQGPAAQRQQASRTLAGALLQKLERALVDAANKKS